MGPANLVYNGIVLSQDPVALDTICRLILEENGCTTGGLATYIETASNPPYNLGNSDLADIEVITIEDPSSITEGSNKPLPNKIALQRNYPEPFNSGTSIPIVLDRHSEVRVDIHNSLGRKVNSLYKGTLSTGRHVLSWSGLDNKVRDMASGRYFVRMTVGGRTHSRMITLMR